MGPLTGEMARRHAPVFNTGLESAVRTLALLVAAHPAAFDIQRLAFFDYLLVHSGDVPGGPPSLHPATPHRSGEFLVRRSLVEHGVGVLMSRGLTERVLGQNGIGYRASEAAASILYGLTSPYAERLRDTAKWVVERFVGSTEQDLGDFFAANLDRWGGEFVLESIVREVP